MGSHNKPGRDTLYESLVKKVASTDGRLPAYDQIDFTPEEKERFEKLSFIDDLVRRKMPILKLADIYKLFSMKYKDSQRQFYRFYLETQQLFGSTGIKQKDYQRTIYIQWLEDAISISFRMGDMKAVGDLIEKAAKLQNLHIADDPSRRQNEIPRNFIVALNINLPGQQDGEPIYFNLDELNKLKPAQYRQYIEEVQNIEYPVSAIQKDIEKSEQE